MVQHITAQNSIFTTTDDAFAGTGPDTLLVDADAYLITTLNSGDGANLTGSWTVTINGAVTSFGNAGIGLLIDGGSTVSKVTIGSAGNVSSSNFGMEFGGTGSVTNKGSVSGFFAAIIDLSDDVTYKNSGVVESNSVSIQVSSSSFGAFNLVNSGTIIGEVKALSPNAPVKITNSGLIEAIVNLGDAADTLVNFVKHGKLIKSGTITGTVNLGAGDDHFKGGAHAESVKDNLGTDHYNLGGGNDTYIADFAGSETDGQDVVNGGSGTDTYFLGGEDGIFLVNLDTKVHNSIPGQSTQEVFLGFPPSLGQVDKIIGFENVTGGDAPESFYGSSGDNVLNGAGGNDTLQGFGGNDRLIGGAGADTLEGGAGRDILTGGPSGSSELDTFVFTKLSDSGVKASTRDVITDFISAGPDADIIDLAQIDANGNAAGEGAFSFIGFNHFSGARGELREAFVKGNTIVSGDVDGDGHADFSIALKGNFVLSGADFFL
jgi:serralysin